MVIFFFNIFIINCIIFSFGNLLTNLLFNEKLNNENISEKPIYGIIFLSFLALLINFILPINKFIGTLTIFVGIINFVLILKNNINLNKKIFKNLLISTFICLILLSYSNIYRPDAGLYHLPYVNLINEHKIIIGSVNINFRYGIISIAQYLSAIQNNFIFDIKSISIPLASIFSFFIIFVIKEVFLNIKKKNINSLIFFLIAAATLLNFGRFSNYGNDAISHIFYFTLIIFILKNFYKILSDKNNFNKLTLISVYLFTTKAFMLLILAIPFIFFIFSNKKLDKILNFGSIFNIIFLLLWIIKSTLISGCVIYPIEKTCLKNVKYYNQERTVKEAVSGEAWAKDWVNQSKKKLDYSLYNKDFNWLETWKKNHLKKIFEKLAPYLFFLLVLFGILLIYKRENKTKKINLNTKEIKFVSISSLVFFLLWFLKFPLFRYGTGFIIIIIIFFLVFLINYFKLIPKKKILLKISKIFLIILTSIFLSKNLIRVSKNLETNKLWPDIYSEKNDYIKNVFQQISRDNQIYYYYSKGKLCMYSKSPCSNYEIKNLNREKIFSYLIYWTD